MNLWAEKIDGQFVGASYPLARECPFGIKGFSLYVKRRGWTA